MKSFEDFFYKKENVLIDLKTISDYTEKNDGNYNLYKGNMLCPECHKAELIFVHKTSNRRQHLRKTQSSQHEKDCSYNFDYAPSKVIRNYFDNLTSEQIQDKINSAMYSLFEETLHNSNTDRINIVKNEESPFLLINDEKEIKNYKSVRRKSLRGSIEEKDRNDIFLFYGKVKLSVNQKEKINVKGEKSFFYFLDVKVRDKNDKWEFKASVYRGSIKDKIDEKKEYNIVMIGNLKSKYDWWSIDLIKKEAIQYKELES